MRKKQSRVSKVKCTVGVEQIRTVVAILLAQWNALLMQQQQYKLQETPRKVADVADPATSLIGLLTTANQEKNKASITEKHTFPDFLWHRLKC